MLTFEQAKKIGVDACIEKLGRDFVNQFKDTSCDAYADMKDYAYCFVGVDNRENRYGEGVPALTSTNKFPYVARCNVRYSDGDISFFDCVLPSQAG